MIVRLPCHDPFPLAESHADHPHLYLGRPVSIKAMICLDTVGALGIPRTGILGIFHALAPFTKNREFMETHVATSCTDTAVPGFAEVDKICHALALHEYRQPFKPTMMHVPATSTQNLIQMWFIGAHGNIGHDTETGSLADIPLAWILQQLHDSGIICNKAKLRLRFPRTALTPRPVSDIASVDWVNDPVNRSLTGFYHLLGSTIRQPGGYFRFGFETREFIHPTVALRNRGLNDKPVIQGYTYNRGPNGTGYWEKNDCRAGTGSSIKSMEPLRIPVPKLGEYEAYLLGIALE
jgi:hypothetical protein